MKVLASAGQLSEIPQPEFTDTWSPWHHQAILVQVNEILNMLGLNPVGQHIEVSDNGMDMFGHVTVERTDGIIPSQSKELKLGFRNSMQKRFALGFVAGEQIMVCSNLQFYGDYKETRIHNSQLTIDALREFIMSAIQNIEDEFVTYEAWFGKLAGLAAHDDDIKVLTYEAMRDNILPPSRFQHFVNNLEEEKRDQDYGIEQTMAHWHGAVTRTLRGQNTNKLMGRTRQLNEYLQTIIAPPRVYDMDLVI